MVVNVNPEETVRSLVRFYAFPFFSGLKRDHSQVMSTQIMGFDPLPHVLYYSIDILFGVHCTFLLPRTSYVKGPPNAARKEGHLDEYI